MPAAGAGVEGGGCGLTSDDGSAPGEGGSATGDDGSAKGEGGAGTGGDSGIAWGRRPRPGRRPPVAPGSFGLDGWRARPAGPASGEAGTACGRGAPLPGWRPRRRRAGRLSDRRRVVPAAGGAGPATGPGAATGRGHPAPEPAGVGTGGTVGGGECSTAGIAAVARSADTGCRGPASGGCEPRRGRRGRRRVISQGCRPATASGRPIFLPRSWCLSAHRPSPPAPAAPFEPAPRRLECAASGLRAATEP